MEKLKFCIFFQKEISYSNKKEVYYFKNEKPASSDYKKYKSN